MGMVNVVFGEGIGKLNLHHHTNVKSFAHSWILEPPLPDQRFIPAHENGVSFVCDHKYFSCTALLLQAPVGLRVKIVGRLCLKILILRRKACLPRPG
jgi:hypothetical protein